MDMHMLEASTSIEAVEEARIQAPKWQVRPPDAETAQRFAEILADDPTALPLPDYVIAPELRLVNGKPGVYIGTGFVRSVAVLKLLKRPTIQARVWRTDGDAAELAFRLALREDALGPRPMPGADRIRNAIHLHELYPTWSNRRVAREVSLSHTRIDQLAKAGWTEPRDPHSENRFNPTRTAERAVRALLDLQRELTTPAVGEALGEALWSLTDEGEEFAQLDLIYAALERSGECLEEMREE